MTARLYMAWSACQPHERVVVDGICRMERERERERGMTVGLVYGTCALDLLLKATRTLSRRLTERRMRMRDRKTGDRCRVFID